MKSIAKISENKWLDYMRIIKNLRRDSIFNTDKNHNWGFQSNILIRNV